MEPAHDCRRIKLWASPVLEGMRNAFEAQGWKVTPAVCHSSYVGKVETMTVTKVARGKGADGYHVESPNGAAFYVQYWDDDNSWTSQRMTGDNPEFSLRNSSKSLKSLLETLRSLERIRDLEDRLRIAFGGQVNSLST